MRLGDKENKRMCSLVLLGSTVEEPKELIAVLDGYRESKASWLELLRDHYWKEDGRELPLTNIPSYHSKKPIDYSILEFLVS